MITIDDFIRLYFRDFDLEEIFRETPEQVAKRIVKEITFNLKEEIRRELVKAGLI